MKGSRICLVDGLAIAAAAATSEIADDELRAIVRDEIAALTPPVLHMNRHERRAEKALRRRRA